MQVFSLRKLKCGLQFWYWMLKVYTHWFIWEEVQTEFVSVVLKIVNVAMLVSQFNWVAFGKYGCLEYELSLFRSSSSSFFFEGLYSQKNN